MMRISILGCGWLGLPLAEKLRDEGHSIKGSTTTHNKLEILNSKNIEPFLLKLNPELTCRDCDDFWDTDILILNIPPGRKRKNVKEFHQKQIEQVLEKLKNASISFVLFVSSTSVYPEKPGTVTEDDTEIGNAVRASGNALLRAENMLRSQSNFETTIVRFGGLYGYDRHPAKYMAGRKDIANGNAPINFIHRDDCIAIIQKIIEENITDEIFNGVSDGHPPKKLFYPAMAELKGVEKPTFKDDDDQNYKLVSNQKLKQKLNYKFKFPNPMDI